MIEFTDFYFRDEKGKKIYDPENRDGRGPSAHWYCSVCNINYASTKQVNASAESHSLLHVKREYVADREFFKGMN